MSASKVQRVKLVTPGTQTVVVPAGCTRGRVRMCGGGGGGGFGMGGNASKNVAAVGGSGGGVAPDVWLDLDLTPGDTLTLTAGAGGAGGNTPAAAGLLALDGEPSTLLGGNLAVTAPGGVRGFGQQTGGNFGSPPTFTPGTASSYLVLLGGARYTTNTARPPTVSLAYPYDDTVRARNGEGGVGTLSTGFHDPVYEAANGGQAPGPYSPGNDGAPSALFRGGLGAFQGKDVAADAPGGNQNWYWGGGPGGGGASSVWGPGGNGGAGGDAGGFGNNQDTTYRNSHIGQNGQPGVGAGAGGGGGGGAGGGPPNSTGVGGSVNPPPQSMGGNGAPGIIVLDLYL